MKYFRLVIICTVFSFFSFCKQQMYAQTALNITLSPVYYDFSVDPGKTIKETIRLQNNTLSAMQLGIQIKKIVFNFQAEVGIRDLSPQDQMGSWFHFSSATISALPQEVTQIPFSISVPQDAAYGYYVAISFNQQAPKTKASESISASAAIPVLLNVKKSGAKIDGHIVTFKAKSFINEYMPIDFITSFENTGNIHIRPTGSIF